MHHQTAFFTRTPAFLLTRASVRTVLAVVVEDWLVAVRLRRPTPDVCSTAGITLQPLTRPLQFPSYLTNVLGVVASHPMQGRSAPAGLP